MNGLISTKDTFDWLHICLNNKKNLYVQSGITGMIGMTGISGKLGISDIIIPRWYKSFPGPNPKSSKQLNKETRVTEVMHTISQRPRRHRKSSEVIWN